MKKLFENLIQNNLKKITNSKEGQEHVLENINKMKISLIYKLNKEKKIKHKTIAK